jgi:hypothetical protein
VGCGRHRVTVLGSSGAASAGLTQAEKENTTDKREQCGTGVRVPGDHATFAQGGLGERVVCETSGICGVETMVTTTLHGEILSL